MCKARDYAEAVANAELDYSCEHGHGGCAAYQNGGACMDELLTTCGCDDCRHERGELVNDVLEALDVVFPPARRWWTVYFADGTSVEVFAATADEAKAAAARHAQDEERTGTSSIVGRAEVSEED